jgi:hypothetical protein
MEERDRPDWEEVIIDALINLEGIEEEICRLKRQLRENLELSRSAVELDRKFPTGLSE